MKKKGIKLATNSNALAEHDGCLQTKLYRVFEDYVAILQTLSADEFKNDATAIGLLSQLKTVKFIGKKAVLLLTFNIVFVQSYCVFTC